MWRLNKVLDVYLEIFHTDGTLDSSGVPRLVNLHLAGPLVIAERAVELRVQRLQVLPLGRGSSLWLSATHFPVEIEKLSRKKWRRPKTTQKKSREAFCWCYLGLSKQCQRSLIRSIHRCLQQWIVDACGSTFSMKALKQPISINP